MLCFCSNASVCDDAHRTATPLISEGLFTFDGQIADLLTFGHSTLLEDQPIQHIVTARLLGRGAGHAHHFPRLVRTQLKETQGPAGWCHITTTSLGHEGSEYWVSRCVHVLYCDKATKS
jgi:hypothetical protein